MKKIDITNHTYGRLTVIKQVDNLKWECVCSCGKSINVHKTNLRSGHTKSCGCLKKDHSFGVCADGLRKHFLYQTWKTMIYRCTKPNRKEYKNYGGRGISVCKRWMIFEYFLIDLLPTYISGMELDRINNDGNYEPSNCNWVERKENKLKTRRIKLNRDSVKSILESTKTPLELANMFNCSRNAIYDVLQRKTWV